MSKTTAQINNVVDQHPEKVTNLNLSEKNSSRKPVKQSSRKIVESINNRFRPIGPEIESQYHDAYPENSLYNNNKKILASSPETEFYPSSPTSFKFQDFIGDTPLVEITNLCKDGELNSGVRVFAKCEFFNPGFSIKDRIVRNILDKAEKEGNLRAGMTVVAASSGNTGASTAMMCAMRGYKCIITTSPKCSKEKMDAIKAYGAKLLVSPPGCKESDKNHYMEMARLLALEDPEKYFDMDQYETLSNPEGHFLTLGPEIWDQTNGNITHFVAAGSTGGTISGTGKFLKSQSDEVKVVLADPVGSIFSEYYKNRKVCCPGKFLVEGVGKGSIPGALNMDVVDQCIQVSDQDAFTMCHRLAREQGICAGGSSGLNAFAALELAKSLNKPAHIVTVFPDLGVKYLSKVYSETWLKENGFCSANEIPSISSPLFICKEEGSKEQHLVEESKEQTSPNKSISSKTNKLGDVDSYLYRDLVGDTPMIDLSHLVKNPLGTAVNVKVLAKCEFFNPGFSIKDRIVQNILNKAESNGHLKPGMTVVAASSGNTGASTAMMCAMRGYKCIITTSPKCSQEKMDAIKAYGAQLLVSPPGAKEGEKTHYMEMARLLALEDSKNYFDMDQYETKSNPEGHYISLGPEIWEQTGGQITHFCAAGSTGGTISGTGTYLKEQKTDVEVVLGDPKGSIFTEYFKKGSHGAPSKFLVEGVGKGSIPGAMDFTVIDRVVPVSDQEAFDTCFKLCREEGVCAGGSSGLNLFTALQVANTVEEDATIVTVFPDLGVKYLSKVYNDEWLKENGLKPPQTT